MKAEVMRYSDNLSVLIPVWNSARYLDIVLGYYQDFGITPTLVIDGKTTDRSADIARQFGCRFIVTDNPTGRSQTIIKAGAAQIKTAWALRMDDDEVPTRELLDYAASVIHQLPSKAIVGFIRYQCATLNGEILASTIHAAHIHRQYRLFQPSLAEYIIEGHTPGYATPEEHRIDAPDSAAMLHLDWIVHSPEERSQKIMRYDSHTPNHGSAWRDYYLADVIDENFAAHLAPICGSSFKKLARQLDRRFPTRVRTKGGSETSIIKSLAADLLAALRK